MIKGKELSFNRFLFSFGHSAESERDKSRGGERERFFMQRRLEHAVVLGGEGVSIEGYYSVSSYFHCCRPSTNHDCPVHWVLDWQVGEL